MSFNEFLYNFGAAALVLVGLLLVVEDVVTVPKLVGFMAVVFSMYQPVKSLSKAYGMIQESVAGSSRVTALLEQESEIKDAPDALDFEGVKESVSLCDVTFSYNEEPVLKSVSYTAPRGSITALVGESGAGKTTFVDLLMRFYDPAEGRIEIDGRDIRRFRRTTLLDRMAIVTQDPFLFNASIRENIRYGRTDATNEEIEAAARAAYIHDFIAGEVEDGYDAVVGERGVKLSGGQRQRITIARALVRNPQILILDEATAALDSESEKRVQMALNNLMKGRTTFVVAHRLSTIQHADTILVLDGGRLVEKGRHDELLESGGVYARLHRQQFQSQSPGPSPDGAMEGP
jgi:subfamily B ATP-binding cassette protein MsbA